MPTNQALIDSESDIPACPRFTLCNASKAFDLRLSAIKGGDPRRGSPDPKILLVTEAPDPKSGSGEAYSGPSAKRIMNYFLEDKFGVCLDYSRRSSPYFVQFLRQRGIYVTSAVKCTMVRGNAQDLNYDVIRRCREEYLDGQIDALDHLEVIVPLGVIAASSVLHLAPRTLRLGRILGISGRGILEADGFYGKKLVVLPHPSGNNYWANPPLPQQDDSAKVSRHKSQFRAALIALRAFLISAGYRLRELPPEFRLGASEFRVS